jgi:hypothetical protein
MALDVGGATFREVDVRDVLPLVVVVVVVVAVTVLFSREATVVGG